MTDHEGVFLVASADVSVYLAAFARHVLRYSAKTKCDPYDAMNFGEAKGLTFDHVLIYPHSRQRRGSHLVISAMSRNRQPKCTSP